MDDRSGKRLTEINNIAEHLLCRNAIPPLEGQLVVAITDDPAYCDNRDAVTALVERAYQEVETRCGGVRQTMIEELDTRLRNRGDSAVA